MVGLRSLYFFMLVCVLVMSCNQKDKQPLNSYNNDLIINDYSFDVIPLSPSIVVIKYEQMEDEKEFEEKYWNNEVSEVEEGDALISYFIDKNDSKKIYFKVQPETNKQEVIYFVSKESFEDLQDYDLEKGIILQKDELINDSISLLNSKKFEEEEEGNKDSEEEDVSDEQKQNQIAIY